MQRSVWLQRCERDVTVPFLMPRCGPQLSASLTSPANALPISSSQDSSLCEGRGPLAREFPWTLPLSGGRATSPQPGVLWTDRWRWPAWPSEPHVYLHERARSLHAQILPLGCSETYLQPYLLLRVPGSFFPASLLLWVFLKVASDNITFSHCL